MIYQGEPSGLITMVVVAIAILSLMMGVTVGYFLKKKDAKAGDNYLHPSALNPRQVLDVRSGLFVAGVVDADVQYDGKQVLITLPEGVDKLFVSKTHHAAKQVFRKGLPIFYGFDNKVRKRGIVFHTCTKIIEPKSGIHEVEVAR